MLGNERDNVLQHLHAMLLLERTVQSISPETSGFMPRNERISTVPDRYAFLPAGAESSLAPGSKTVLLRPIFEHTGYRVC
jgi:hypothetical protein